MILFFLWTHFESASDFGDQTRQTSTSNHAEGALIIHQRHHNEIAALTQLREGDRWGWAYEEGRLNWRSYIYGQGWVLRPQEV